MIDKQKYKLIYSYGDKPVMWQHNKTGLFYFVKEDGELSQGYGTSDIAFKMMADHIINSIKKGQKNIENEDPLSFAGIPNIQEISDVTKCMQEIRTHLTEVTPNEWFHVKDVSMFLGNADKVVGTAADTIMARVYMDYAHLKEEGEKKRKDMSFIGNSKMYCTILLMINIELIKFIASEYYRPEKLDKLNEKIKNTFTRLKESQEKAKAKYVAMYKDVE